MSSRSGNRASAHRALGILAAVLVGLLACSGVLAAPPAVSRFVLPNGIRVVVLHAPKCKHLAIISCLPLGLAADGKGKTQWSHLVEHLTLRTTGPITDYQKRNGETMAQGIHLDFLGTSDEWKQGLDLHAKWLSGAPFSAESLREELPKALAEVTTTSARQFTHKWATAAWCQVARHGRSDVAVRGDLQSARLGDVQAYRDRHLAPLDRVVVCVIGGIEPDTLKPALQERLGGITSAAKALPAATARPAAAKRRDATWDLDVTHYVETYPIVPRDHKDYPAITVAAAMLRQSLFKDTELRESAGLVLCGTDLVTPEQAYLHVSAPLKPGADAAKVARLIERHVGRLRRRGNELQIPMLAAALSRQMSAPPDLAVAMRHKPAQVTAALIVANVALQWGLLEFQFGEALPALAKAVGRVSAANVASVAERYLSSDRRATLILTPRKAAKQPARPGR